MHRIVPMFAQMDEELVPWKERWCLDGYSVTCRACGAAQDIEAAGQPFPHKEGCRHRDGMPQYPWQVLRQVGVRAREQNH